MSVLWDGFLNAMSHRFVRCPHCKMPHDAAERVCPTTGRRMPADSASTGARSRMSELPPPERRPEPLGFDPAKNRIAEQEAARGSARPATGSLAPTRNLQQDLIGRTVSERYLVRGVLGEGGMGTVYEAEHIGLGRQVAIKVLNPSQAKKRVAVKRFQQEARAAGAIGHPNICEVYDLGLLDDGSPYLVMEKLVGSTLADRISREGGLPFDEILDVMTQVLSGLIAAHDKGIVHRDIKPENIFLARRVGCPPIVKILDFGVSKMMPQFQGGDDQLDLTRTGMVMGTPYYMSPEQARGERNLDGRVDVYACGVMMYESIVGKRPFLAPNYNALLLSIINTVPKSLREVRPATPQAMEAVVGRMMAKARDDRYATANAVLRDIQALPAAMSAMSAMSGGGRAPSAAPSPPSEERRGAKTTGGRVAVQERARPERAEGPGATLRSRMADAQSPRHRSSPPPAPAPESADRSTRQRPRQSTSDSYDIPIHITGSDLQPLVPDSSNGSDFVDEMPTEVFRPGFHPSPVAPARSPNETRIHQAPQRPPQQRVVPQQQQQPFVPPQQQPQHYQARPQQQQHVPQQQHLQQQYPQHPAPPPQQQHVPQQQQQYPQQPAAPPQTQPHLGQQYPQQRPAAGRPPGPAPAATGVPPQGLAPVNFSGLVGDEWDSETVVKKPAALTTTRHRDRPPPSGRGRAAAPQPFNPDETINLNGEGSAIDVDFGEETHASPPPQHHQPPPRRR